jgi:hypothetical protein
MMINYKTFMLFLHLACAQHIRCDSISIAKSEIFESSWNMKNGSIRSEDSQLFRESKQQRRQREGEMGHLQLNHFT